MAVCEWVRNNVTAWFFCNEKKLGNSSAVKYQMKSTGGTKYRGEKLSSEENV